MKDEMMVEADGTRAGSERYFQLRERIVAAYPELSLQLKSIAQFALQNPDRMAVETTSQLAARLGVPPSGIVRFAQAMGYSGFLEMKRTFSEHLMYRAQALDAPEPADDRPAGHLVSAIAQARRDLALLEREHELEVDLFEDAVGALDATGNVFVSAQHASYPFASLFAWRMIEGGRQCILLDNVGGTALRLSELAGPSDATLAISFSPYQPSVVEAATAHRRHGGSIVAITDTMLSPLVPHANVVLVVAGGGAKGSTGPATLVCALADAVAERARERQRRKHKGNAREVIHGNG